MTEAIKYVNGNTAYIEFCVNCAYYEEEYKYCFRLGSHAPKTGYCEHYCDELPKEG